MTDESRKPYLSPTADPTEIGLNVEIAEEKDLRHLFSIFAQSEALRFRVNYTLDGTRWSIEPQEFEAVREEGPERDTFFRDRPKEVSGATDVSINVINPRKNKR